MLCLSRANFREIKSASDTKSSSSGARGYLWLTANQHLVFGRHENLLFHAHEHRLLIVGQPAYKLRTISYRTKISMLGQFMILVNIVFKTSLDLILRRWAAERTQPMDKQTFLALQISLTDG